MTNQVAEYKPLEAKINEIVASNEGRVYDVSTVKGFDEVKKMRAMFRTARTSLDKVRKEVKAPLIEQGRIIEAEAKSLAALLEPGETRLASIIKEEENRKLVIKQEKERVELERVRHIRYNIAEMDGLPAAVVMGSADDVLGAIEKLMEVNCKDGFMEFEEVAATAKKTVMAKLIEMRESKSNQEAKEAQLEIDRKALEKEKAEIAAQKKLDEAELERVNEIRGRLANMAKTSELYNDCDLSGLEDALEIVVSSEPNEKFAEFIDEAKALWKATIADINSRIDAKKKYLELQLATPGADVDTPKQVKRFTEERAKEELEQDATMDWDPADYIAETPENTMREILSLVNDPDGDLLDIIGEVRRYAMAFLGEKD